MGPREAAARRDHLPPHMIERCRELDEQDRRMGIPPRDWPVSTTPASFNSLSFEEACLKGYSATEIGSLAAIKSDCRHRLVATPEQARKMEAEDIALVATAVVATVQGLLSVAH